MNQYAQVNPYAQTNPYATVNPYAPVNSYNPLMQQLTKQTVQEAQAFSAEATGAEKQLLEMTKAMALQEKEEQAATLKALKNQADEQLRLFRQCPPYASTDFQALYSRFQTEMAHNANEEILKILLRDMSIVVVRCMDPSYLRTLVENQLHAITAFKASECSGYAGTDLETHEHRLTQVLLSTDREEVLKVTQEAETYLNDVKKVCADYSNSSRIRQWMVQNPGKTKLVGAALAAGLVAAVGPDKIKDAVTHTYDKVGNVWQSMKERVFGTAEEQALKEVVAENAEKPNPTLSAEMPITEREKWVNAGQRFHARNALLKQRDEKKAAIKQREAMLAEEKAKSDAELVAKASETTATTDAAYAKAFEGLNVTNPPYQLPKIMPLQLGKEGPPVIVTKSKQLVAVDPDTSLKRALASSLVLAGKQAGFQVQQAITKENEQKPSYDQVVHPYLEQVITYQLKMLFNEMVRQFPHYENLTKVLERLSWMQRFKKKYGLLCRQLWQENPRLVANQSEQMVLAMNTFIFALKQDILGRAGFFQLPVMADVDVRLVNDSIQVTYNGMIRFVPVSLV